MKSKPVWLLQYMMVLCFAVVSFSVHAQSPEYVNDPDVRSITLIRSGDMYSYPVINLNTGEQLQLDFDVLGSRVKNYYYTYQLCNADWTPSTLFSFDYIRGFQTTRITTYRNSSIALTKYVHYQVTFPERSSVPSRSGNYLLKIFLDNDTSKVVFTKRFFVVDSKAAIAAQILQPFSAQLFRSFQKIITAVTLNGNINVFNQQDIKVVIVQNFSWANAMVLDRPTIFRGNYFEYNDESYSFPAGKEWRWIDLRSLRLMSDRMQYIDKKRDSTDVYVKPDNERKGQVYIYQRDLDGLFTIENSDNVNPYWQGDYAKVHFSFFPPGNRPYEGKEVHLYGALTNYTPNDSSKMVFNPDRGAYERTLFLKQGYYNYSYVTVPDNRQSAEKLSYENTEGNYWATENSYTIFVYYRSFGARADELIGYTLLNSAFTK